MAKVIAVLNSKGGSGKTTISTNIGGCLHKKGHKVLIVDSDPQGSARDWYEAQPDDVELPPVVGVDRPILHKNIPSISAPYEFIIIDGAAKLEEMTASAIMVADFILIPVKHSAFDIWAVETLVESIKARQLITDGKPRAAFVISCQSQGTRLAKSIDEALSDFELPILKARTTNRIAYEEAGGAGLSVLDLAGRDKAAIEIEEITNELLEMMNHAKVQA